MHHAMQPLELDEHGVLRFKKNAIVEYVLEWASERGCDLNVLAEQGFGDEDWQQFAQLIGYSLSGYGDLSYVTNDNFGVAKTMFDEGLNDKDARIAYLEHELYMVRASLREPMARLFGVHPDDLVGESDGE